MPDGRQMPQGQYGMNNQYGNRGYQGKGQGGYQQNNQGRGGG